MRTQSLRGLGISSPHPTRKNPQTLPEPERRNGDSTTPKSRLSGKKRPELSSGCLSIIWKRTAGLKESLVPEAARNLATCGALSTGRCRWTTRSTHSKKMPPPSGPDRCGWWGQKLRDSPRDQLSTEPPSVTVPGELAKSPATGGFALGVASSPKTSAANSPSGCSPAGAVSNSNPSGTSTSIPTSR